MGRRPYARQMRDTITYQLPSATRTRAGELQWGAQVSAPARVSEDLQVVRTGADTEVVATHLVATYAPLVDQARVWLPGADTNEASAAVLVRAVKSERPTTGGDLLYEARLG